MRLICKLILAGSFFVAFSSCEKDNIRPSGSISYKVDGVQKSLSTSARYDTDNSVLVNGSGPGGEKISLYIFMHTRTGGFQFDKDIDSALAIYKPGSFVSDSGKLTITAFDGRHISGTFGFRSNNGSLKKNITDGQFTAIVLNPGEITELPPVGSDTVTGAAIRNKIHIPK